MNRREPAGEGRRNRWALLPLLLATFTGTVANSIVNVPLALIVADLGVTVAAGSLIVVAFAAVLASLMPVTGWLADRWGRRRVFVCAMGAMAGSSAGAAFAPDLGILVLCRAAQGAACAAVLPTVMALLVTSSGERRRSRTLGLWAAANGLGQAAGPALGGALATWFGWRAVFWPIVALALLALAGALWLLPRDAPRPLRLDWGGALMLTLAAALMMGSAAATAPLGPASPLVWGSAFAGIAATCAFLLVERGRADPFLHLHLLLETRYLRSCLAALAQMFCLGALLIGIPLYLTGQKGATPLASGLVLLSIPVTMALLAPVVGALSDRWGARHALRFGLVLLIIGQLLTVAAVALDSGVGPLLITALIAAGAGMASVQTPAATGASRSRLGRHGTGLGLFNLVRFGGSGLGAAWVALAVDRSPMFGSAFAVCAGVAVIGLVGAFAGRDPGPDTRPAPRN